MMRPMFVSILKMQFSLDGNQNRHRKGMLIVAFRTSPCVQDSNDVIIKLVTMLSGKEFHPGQECIPGYVYGHASETEHCLLQSSRKKSR